MILFCDSVWPVGFGRQLDDQLALVFLDDLRDHLVPVGLVWRLTLVDNHWNKHFTAAFEPKNDSDPSLVEPRRGDDNASRADLVDDVRGLGVKPNRNL